MKFNPNDKSPNMHDPVTQTSHDYSYRENLDKFFASSPGSNTEKLENFGKYAPRQSLARFLARYEIFKHIQNIQGSIVECGVLFGGGLMSFANISTIMEPYNFQRRLYGFDTFEGFPDIAAKDTVGLKDRKSGHLKKGGFTPPTGTYEDLLKAIELYDSNRLINHFPKVNIIKGDFVKTSEQFLKDYPHLVISCLYLDFDIYAPTKVALERFAPRVCKGGIIVFDELNEEAFPGETLAAMEYFGDMNKIKVRRFTFEPRISYMIVGE